MNVKGADSARTQNAKQVSERRVVREVEPETRGVDEQELAGDAELQLLLVLDHLSSKLRQLREIFLHRRVFNRIELDCAQRSVERDDEVSPATLHIRASTRFTLGS